MKIITFEGKFGKFIRNLILSDQESIQKDGFPIFSKKAVGARLARLPGLPGWLVCPVCPVSLARFAPGCYKLARIIFNIFLISFIFDLSLNKCDFSSGESKYILGW